MGGCNPFKGSGNDDADSGGSSVGSVPVYYQCSSVLPVYQCIASVAVYCQCSSVFPGRRATDGNNAVSYTHLTLPTIYSV